MSKRKSYYAQAMTIINEEMPLLAIAHSKRFQARGVDVKGDILENFGGISFYDVYKNNEISNTNKVMAPNKKAKVVD